MSPSGFCCETEPLSSNYQERVNCIRTELYGRSSVSISLSLLRWSWRGMVVGIKTSQRLMVWLRKVKEGTALVTCVRGIYLTISNRSQRIWSSPSHEARRHWLGYRGWMILVQNRMENVCSWYIYWTRRTAISTKQAFGAAGTTKIEDQCMSKSTRECACA